MAPLILELKRRELFSISVCCTGQHTEMLETALRSFDINPDVNLTLDRLDTSLSALTGSLLTAIDGYITDHKPKIVLVHGDTTSAFVGALSAFYNGFLIGHVEAGLRSNRIDSPFPEEFNRRAIAISAHYHFAPTETAKRNLLNEGVDPSKVYITGNTVIDALNLTEKRIIGNAKIRYKIENSLQNSLGFCVNHSKYVLITAHRRENFGSGIENICAAILSLSEKNRDLKFVFPVHLNPIVKNKVYEALAHRKNIALIEPQSYLNFVWLLRNCFFALTDSGGIQEEAPTFGKPVLVMRETSERPEAIEAGAARLVSSEIDKIVSYSQQLIDDADEYKRMSKISNPFGDGHAAQNIGNILEAQVTSF